MPEISISLVRKCHPDVDVNDLHMLDVLRLANQGITFIDNLEVFSSVRALFLNGNFIRIIENLEFLSVLDHLDLSGNQIDSESLLKSLDNIPRHLGSINLTNNPCCSDENCLLQLQERLPDLGIIIGLDDEPKPESIQSESKGEPVTSTKSHRETNPGEDDLSRRILEEKGQVDENDEDDSEDDENDEDNASDTEADSKRGGTEVIDADSVLKALVDRKCRLQNLGHENAVAAALSVLNKDCEEALKKLSVRGRFSLIDENEHSNSPVTSRSSLPPSPTRKFKIRRAMRYSNQEGEDSAEPSIDFAVSTESDQHEGHNSSRGIIADEESDIIRHVDSRFAEYRRRAEEMLAASRRDGIESQLFMDKLRQRNTTKRETAFNGLKESK